MAAARRELTQKLRRVWPHLNERGRRMLAAAEALAFGHGGVSQVSRACGLSRVTILNGIRDLQRPALPEGRVRQPGGGRKPLVIRDPALPTVLESLVEPLARGDPQSPLRWTCKSTRTLAQELTKRHHPISHEKVAQLLRGLDYRLQGTRKTEEGTDHPDRDAQFRYINTAVRRALAQGWPVVSVDTKKKELVGTSPTRAASGARRRRPRASTGTTFPHRRCREPIPMGSTICDGTPAS